MEILRRGARKHNPEVYRYENTFELAVMLIIKRKEY
jgi:hypothetical protein